MPHVAWTLTDYSTGSPEVFAFPINPNEFSPPGRQANIATELGTAPNAAPIIFQGRDQITRGSFAGVVNTEDFYLNLRDWLNKWYVLELTDDQGRTWDILVTQVEWTRIRRANNQWRFDYGVDFIGVA
jgi:hypothetical protein